MRRTVIVTGFGLVAALALAGCSGTASTATGGTGTTTPPTTASDGHSHSHGGADDGYLLRHPLRVTPDGLIDPASIDLSGIEGVTEEQQRQSTDLLVRTIRTLPRWSDYDQALADGFQSIGDQLTGEEHVIRWDWIDDDVMLDPNQPESLVYKYDRATGTRTLEAAMFLMPKQYTLDDQPAIASRLVQFHQHDNLCFTAPPAPRVAGLTNFEGGCNPPLVKFNPNIMVHVWIRPNVCGPFAALTGVGAGQIAEGEERSCVHDDTRLTL